MRESEYALEHALFVDPRRRLADKLEQLCCAETESAFFDCVTDNIQTILTTLRAAATAREALRIIAGEQQCLDNLMSNADVARAALALFEKE